MLRVPEAYEGLADSPMIEEVTFRLHCGLCPPPNSYIETPKDGGIRRQDFWEVLRIARRDKKAFLSDQCKEMEENNIMEEIEDLFKKIKDTKGTFHAEMVTIKDRNGMDLTEAEDIQKRWQEYEKDFHDPGNHDGVITHLEPDILECEVKWALGSITMNKVV